MDVPLDEDIGQVLNPRNGDQDVNEGDYGLSQGGHQQDHEDGHDVEGDVDKDGALLYDSEVETLLLELLLYFAAEAVAPDLVVFEIYVVY